MMRSYLSLSLSLGLCLMLAVGCGDDENGTAGTGGTGGTGGTQSGGLQTKDITVGCSNNVTTDISILPAELEVDSEEITGGAEFTASLTGGVAFPVFFLDAAQSVIPGGVRAAELVAGQLVVQVRSGTTAGDDVILTPDVDTITPGSISFCAFSLGTCSTTTATTCTQDNECPSGETCEGYAAGPGIKECDKANDNADGSNPDCLPAVEGGPACSEPVVLADIPISEDCAAGGVCAGIGKSAGGTCSLTPPPNLTGSLTTCYVQGDCTGEETCYAAEPSPGDQCVNNGFCVTGGLEFALVTEDGTYTAEASGDVLFGWADEGLSGPTLGACNGGTREGLACGDPPNCPGAECEADLYVIPGSSPSQPIQQGIDVKAGPLTVRVFCVMAVDSAGADGVAVCVGGDNDGTACTSPADVGNDVCVGGDNDGDACEEAADCPGGDCANADCGVGGDCTPTDLASYTPDSALIRYTIP